MYSVDTFIKNVSWETLYKKAQNMHNFNINIRILCMIDRIEIAVVCCVIIKYYMVALIIAGFMSCAGIIKLCIYS